MIRVEKERLFPQEFELSPVQSDQIRKTVEELSDPEGELARQIRHNNKVEQEYWMECMNLNCLY